MIGTLSNIFRHPIKSIGAEAISSASLTEGRALPLDRVWGVLHEGSKIEAHAGRTDWARKMNFLVGVSAPDLMAVTHETLENQFCLRHPAKPEICFNPETPEGQAAFLAWISDLWPEHRPRPTVLAKAKDQPLTDQSTPVLSLIGTASLREVSEACGCDLDMRRFRANLWVSDWAPMYEQTLIGQRLRMGEAELEVVEPVGRCRAPDGNPATGERDQDLLKLLKDQYGHTNLGVFVRVTKSGEIATGSTIEVI
ncbi:MOSC domain-containing protein [Thioclava sp. GXIMD4216]|uniref:MOSC domain-containing protein n=1 Tax=unclassified Thioclava TaxID=2621713 RepID=UPI0030D3E752